MRDLPDTPHRCIASLFLSASTFLVYVLLPFVSCTQIVPLLPSRLPSGVFHILSILWTSLVSCLMSSLGRQSPGPESVRVLWTSLVSRLMSSLGRQPPGPESVRVRLRAPVAVRVPGAAADRDERRPLSGARLSAPAQADRPPSAAAAAQM